jgi:hypothetical protein
LDTPADTPDPGNLPFPGSFFYPSETIRLDPAESLALTRLDRSKREKAARFSSNTF